MAQPFLLSAQARTLSLKAIYRDTEKAAYATFLRLRWPETKGEPVCPPLRPIERLHSIGAGEGETGVSPSPPRVGRLRRKAYPFRPGRNEP